ncbi:hypothetical protein Tco_0247730 [Tanacetum coccineum]
MWILGTNLIFAFSRKFWSSFRVPSTFDYRDANLFQLLDFSIYDFHCIVDITESSEAQLYKPPVPTLLDDLKWSNVLGVKLSSLSESDDTFLSLQALSNLYYLFSGFMDYLWSRELDISNFGPADRLEACLECLDVFTLSISPRDDNRTILIRSWRLFPFSGVHVLETFSGTVLYMFADTPYPLSASTMKKMLKHKLEVEINGIGNDMTHAEQLIAFIKNRLAACLPSA